MTAAVRRLEGYFETCLEVLKAETIRQKAQDDFIENHSFLDGYTFREGKAGQ